MHDDIDYEEIRRMRDEHMTARQIGKRMGLGENVVLGIIKKLGLPRVVRKPQDVDVPKLFRVWHDTSLTMAEVAREVGVTVGYLYRLADLYGLPERARQVRVWSLDDAATPEEEELSRDSLALAPEVRRRIKELGLGMPVLEHPDVRPWFHTDCEPGPYTEDDEDGYAYDE